MNLSGISHLICGPVFDSELLERFKSDFKQIPRDVRIIAVDGGADFCRLMGLIPDEYFGDNDSLSAEGLDFLKEQKVPLEVFDTEKDFSDFAAVIQKIAKESKELRSKAQAPAEEDAPSVEPEASVLVVGMSGGRLDQLLAVLGEAYKAQMPRIAFYGKAEYIELLNASSAAVKTKIEGGQLFSLLSFSPYSKVCINQAKWELAKAQLEFLSSVGLSNIGPAEITIVEGASLVIVNH